MVVEAAVNRFYMDENWKLSKKEGSRSRSSTSSTSPLMRDSSKRSGSVVQSPDVYGRQYLQHFVPRYRSRNYSTIRTLRFGSDNPLVLLLLHFTPSLWSFAFLLKQLQYNCEPSSTVFYVLALLK
ncbi:hypothetical protein HHK36_019086 [Tetracentron sinense]|uniref:Uncharacterized protein n=1 Tax=Tetracentron sinense TaxID=13715 RepID=A0A834YX13_TETSI|nr:hypothetical protein HHK36_019086 [Tetracentron sinense]